jgi:hypothetical protein
LWCEGLQFLPDTGYPVYAFSSTIFLRWQSETTAFSHAKLGLDLAVHAFRIVASDSVQQYVSRRKAYPIFWQLDSSKRQLKET